MTERDRYMIELLEMEDSNNLALKIQDLEKINNSVFKFTHCLFENKLRVPYHLSELEGKYFRFGAANQSIASLLKGNQFTMISQPVNLIDIFSIHSVTRMQIESFIIMNYLFFDKVSAAEKEFRYDIYKLHGLNNQARFKIKDLNEKIEIQRNKILSEIAGTRERIINSLFYVQANERQKDLYLNPPYAKLVDSKILFVAFGLEKTRIRDLWKLYSNSAHNEHIHDRQFNYAINNGSVDIDTYSLILSVAKILTTRLLRNLIDEFKCVNDFYSKMLEKERVSIDIWSKLT